MDKKKLIGLTDGRVAVILIMAILIIDQVIKIAVKTHLCLGESIHVTNWFYIVFVENAGMAYGIQILNKIFLSLFRLVAVGVLGWYLHWELKHHGRTRYIMILSLIIAGAAGNIIDCMFYGLIFTSASPFALSTFVPFGSGYAPVLMGKVVECSISRSLSQRGLNGYPWWEDRNSFSSLLFSISQMLPYPLALYCSSSSAAKISNVSP